MRSSALFKLNIYARLTSTLLSAFSLLLYAFIISYVLDQRFPSDKPGLTVLPAIALASLTIWNILALTLDLVLRRFSSKLVIPSTSLQGDASIRTDTKTVQSFSADLPARTPVFSKGVKLFFLIPDSLLTLLLLGLGSVGFAHDANTYLGNAMYQQYDDGPWLAEEIAAGCGMVGVVLLQLLVIKTAVLAPRRAARESAFIAEIETAREVDEPPAYLGNFDLKGEKGEKQG